MEAADGNLFTAIQLFNTLHIVFILSSLRRKNMLKALGVKD